MGGRFGHRCRGRGPRSLVRRAGVPFRLTGPFCPCPQSAWNGTLDGFIYGGDYPGHDEGLQPGAPMPADSKLHESGFLAHTAVYLTLRGGRIGRLSAQQLLLPARAGNGVSCGAR